VVVKGIEGSEEIVGTEVIQVQPVPPALQVQLGHKGYRVLRAPKDLLELQVLQALRVHKG
jgi:hypothetical protein